MSFAVVPSLYPHTDQPHSVTPVNLDSQDVLQIDTLAGNDTVDTRGLQRGLVQLLVL